MPFQTFAPEPYTRIKTMVKNYHQTFRLISSTLNSPTSPVRLNIQDEPVGYVISKDDFDRIKTNISAVAGFEKYLFLFGIDPDTDNLTFCIVAADANGNVCQIYKDNPTTYGEEKWPTACTAKLSDTSLDQFLGV
jgi:hypothetical protein